MRRLNRGAAEALSALGATPPHAVTDVTGFGLLGHAWEMAERSESVLEIDTSALPLYAGALAAAEAGVRTGGDARNRVHLEGRVDVDRARGPGGAGLRPPDLGGTAGRGGARRRPTIPGWPPPASWPSAGWSKVRRACACCNGAPAAGDLPILCVTATADG